MERIQRMSEPIMRILKFFCIARDNYRVAVLGPEGFRRLEGPGHFWLKPLETLGLPIKITPSWYHFTLEEVFCRDNVPVDIDVTVVCKFDPAMITDRSMLSQFAQFTPERIGFVVRNATDHCLRRIVEEFDVQAVCGRHSGRIEGRLAAALPSRLKPMGFSFAPNSVRLGKVRPPEEYQALIMDRERFKLVSQGLDSCQNGKADLALQHESIKVARERGFPAIISGDGLFPVPYRFPPNGGQDQ